MAGPVECICNALEDINGFHSILEFERFQKYIEGLVKKGDLIEIPVEKHYAGFPEQWFQCVQCHQIWRMVHPDFPFRGIWEKVK